jgi:hypothetical protein
MWLGARIIFRLQLAQAALASLGDAADLNLARPPKASAIGHLHGGVHHLRDHVVGVNTLLQHGQDRARLDIVHALAVRLHGRQAGLDIEWPIAGIPPIGSISMIKSFQSISSAISVIRGLVGCGFSTESHAQASPPS